jgi:hypothetical protein
MRVRLGFSLTRLARSLALRFCFPSQNVGTNADAARKTARATAGPEIYFF